MMAFASKVTRKNSGCCHDCPRRTSTGLFALTFPDRPELCLQSRRKACRQSITLGMALQKALGIHSRHTALPCRSDRLSIHLVLHIARQEYPGQCTDG